MKASSSSYPSLKFLHFKGTKSLSAFYSSYQPYSWWRKLFKELIYIQVSSEEHLRTGISEAVLQHCLGREIARHQ